MSILLTKVTYLIDFFEWHYVHTEQKLSVHFLQFHLQCRSFKNVNKLAKSCLVWQGLHYAFNCFVTFLPKNVNRRISLCFVCLTGSVSLHSALDNHVRLIVAFSHWHRDTFHVQLRTEWRWNVSCCQCVSASISLWWWTVKALAGCDTC